MSSFNSVFKAVAHPTRREIISLLAVSARSVTDLTSEFNVSQAAISQHLKELRSAGLVTSQRVGVKQLYRLTPRPLGHILRWSAQYRNLIDPSGHVWSFVSMKGLPRKSKSREKRRHGN